MSERRSWYSVVGLRSIKFRLPITFHRTQAGDHKVDRGRVTKGRLRGGAAAGDGVADVVEARLNRRRRFI